MVFPQDGGLKHVKMLTKWGNGKWKEKEEIKRSEPEKVEKNEIQDPDRDIHSRFEKDIAFTIVRKRGKGLLWERHKKCKLDGSKIHSDALY